MQCAKDHVGEGGSKTDGVGEGRDWELVFARLDWRSTEMCKGTIGIERVELFLGLDCGEGVEHELLDPVAADAVAWHIVCDVVDEIGKEGDLEQLVESDELETGQSVCCDRGWRWAVGQCSVGLLFDGGELRRRVGDVGEAV